MYKNKNTMKIISCSDSGLDCDFISEGKTKKEVMDSAIDHIREKHPTHWDKFKVLPPDQVFEILESSIKEL